MPEDSKFIEKGMEIPRSFVERGYNGLPKKTPEASIIKVRIYKPKSVAPDSALIIRHGVTGHETNAPMQNMVPPLVESLSDAGISVVTFNAAGHGQGRAEHWLHEPGEEAIEVLNIAKHLRNKGDFEGHKYQKFAGLGHSRGGEIMAKAQRMSGGASPELATVFTVNTKPFKYLGDIYSAMMPGWWEATPAERERMLREEKPQIERLLRAGGTHQWVRQGERWACSRYAMEQNRGDNFVAQAGNIQGGHELHMFNSPRDEGAKVQAMFDALPGEIRGVKIFYHGGVLTGDHMLKEVPADGRELARKVHEQLHRRGYCRHVK